MWLKYKFWASKPTRPQSYHPVHSLWMCKPQSIQAGDNWIVPKSWLTHGLSLTTGSLIWFPVLTVSSNFSKQGWVCVYLYHQIKWRYREIWSVFEYHVFDCCYWNEWKIKFEYGIQKMDVKSSRSKSSISKVTLAQDVCVTTPSTLLCSLFKRSFSVHLLEVSVRLSVLLAGSKLYKFLITCI